MTASICRIYIFDKQFTDYDYLKLLQPKRTSSQKFVNTRKTRRQRPITPLQTILRCHYISPFLSTREQKERENRVERILLATRTTAPRRSCSGSLGRGIATTSMSSGLVRRKGGSISRRIHGRSWRATTRLIGRPTRRVLSL